MINDKVVDTGRPIGGWLILLAIGAIFSPIRLVVTLWPLYEAIFVNGVFEALTNPQSINYVYGFRFLILFEVVINAMLVVALIWQATLFFCKKKLYRAVFIVTSVFSLTFILIDAVAASAVFPDIAIFAPDTVKEIARSLVAVVIWVPYLLLSERVKETFVL
jgi:hypothetical protein